MDKQYEIELLRNLCLLSNTQKQGTWKFQDGTMAELLMDLKYNVRDKLLIARHLAHKNHVNIENFLSKRDLLIIDTLKMNKIFDEKFIHDLCKNKLMWQNQAAKNVELIVRYLNNSQLDNSPKYSKIYKWIGLKNHGEAKIDTIINEQIYLANPIEFNDRFDCQLHPTKDFYKHAGFQESETWRGEYIKFLAFETILATSFTLCHPLQCKSAHMWGLYGEQGSGIAIGYEIDSLFIKQLETSAVARKFSFDLVKYIDEFNLGILFKEFIKKGPKQDGWKYLYKFMFNKNITWQHEQELRIVYMHDDLVQKAESFKNKNELSQKSFNQLKVEYCELLKSEKYVNFMTPSEIILGWNVEACNKVSELRAFADKKNIKIYRLTGEVDYFDNQFSYQTQ